MRRFNWHLAAVSVAMMVFVVAMGFLVYAGG